MVENSAFKFLGYRIPKIEMNIDDKFGVTGREEIEHEINIGYSLNPEEKRFVEVKLTITLTAKSNNFTFLLEIKGGFQADESMRDDVFKKLYTQNAPAILYPFARSVVSNYMAQANIPPFLLPLINLTKNETAEKIEE